MTTGDDIVAILERLALSAETSKHLTLYGQMRLMPAAGVCDIIHQAMDTIVDLRVELEEAKWLLIEAKVQLEEGKAKTRRNRAGLIDQFFAKHTPEGAW